MNETMLAVLGFATIIALVFIFMKNVMGPAMAFVTVGFVDTIILAATGTFSLKEVGGFIGKGVTSTAPTACLFLFSVVFFGIMTDAGMFDKIIKALLGKVGNNVVGVAVMTAIIAMIGHLDGSGASTFLITIPAMLPIYKKLHMRATTLMLICVVAMGAMNLLPWGGPTLRVATILSMDANVLWKRLLPVQILGLLLGLLTAVIWGNIEKKRGAGLQGRLAQMETTDEEKREEEEDQERKGLARPRLFVFNIILTLVVILCLIFLPVPSYFSFMVGCMLALVVNYGGAKMQNVLFRRHADAAIMMASTLFGAGVFLGVLDESGIMKNMANLLAGGIPASLGVYLPIIIGAISVPVSLGFSTDSYFYGILPVLVTLGNQWGVNPLSTGIAMVVCRNCATFVTPAVPATFLGCGLAGVEIKDHIRTSLLWAWGVSLICLAFGVIIGII